MKVSLVQHVRTLGAESITDKPYKSTTQGNNERFHRILFRYLDTRPLANDLDERQAMVDDFDHVYNNQRPYQALPGRMAPAQAWAATPPRPDPARDEPVIPGDPPAPATTTEEQTPAEY